MAVQRLAHIRRFYRILRLLQKRLGGPRHLSDCTPDMDWPLHGVYFFFEEGENRSHSGSGPRVVRVGTHGLRAGAQSTLWQRLYQHLTGPSSFRDHVYDALNARGARADGEAISRVIAPMPFLWLKVRGRLQRDRIERNSIALLSNYLSSADYPAVDEPSERWLGRYCPDVRVKQSGLWNVHYVDQPYDEAFLDDLERLVQAMPAPRL